MNACFTTDPLLSQVISVYGFTSVRLGGLGWDITWISYIFMVLAGAQVLIYLIAFPAFLRIFGVRRGLLFTGCTLIGVFVTAPFSNLALRAGREAAAYTCLSATAILAVVTNLFWGRSEATAYRVSMFLSGRCTVHCADPRHIDALFQAPTLWQLMMHHRLLAHLRGSTPFPQYSLLQYAR